MSSRNVVEHIIEDTSTRMCVRETGVRTDVCEVVSIRATCLRCDDHSNAPILQEEI